MPAEDAAVAELNKKLETKEKEAADWKVRRAFESDVFQSLQTDSVLRTNASVPLPTFVTFRIAPSAK